MDKPQCNRQMLDCPCKGPAKLNIFINEKSGKYFYGDGSETARNRVIPKRVWIDENGSICVLLNE